MKNRIITGIIFVVLGGLIALGPQHLFKTCETMNGQIPKCFWSARTEIGIGALIALSGILQLVFKSAQARLGINILIALTGILAALIPTVLIGVCDMPTMKCRILTLPALLVLSILVVLASVINAIYLTKIGKREKIPL